MKSPAIVVILSALAFTTLMLSEPLSAGPSEAGAQPASFAKSPLDALRALEGTWITDAKPGDDADQCVYRVTANGSAVIETMFPGQEHEMVNVFHMDGKRLIVTHYCAQGVQPRMKLVSSDGGVMKFEFLDCTNLKPGAGHMGSLELTIAGDKLIEKWGYIKDGKVDHHATFELKRKA